MRSIDKIIMHHTGPGCRDIYDIWNIHVIQNGWSDIGYHFISFGERGIRLGRSIEIVGAHCKGHNTGSIGFCILGDYTNYDEDYDGDYDRFRTEAMFVADLCRHYSLESKDVYGHNQFERTICPGFDMDQFRPMVEFYIEEWRRKCTKR